MNKTIFKLLLSLGEKTLNGATSFDETLDEMAGVPIKEEAYRTALRESQALLGEATARWDLFLDTLQPGCSVKQKQQLDDMKVSINEIHFSVIKKVTELLSIPY